MARGHLNPHPPFRDARANVCAAPAYQSTLLLPRHEHALLAKPRVPRPRQDQPTPQVWLLE
jgi:hypothetical protein